MLSNFGKLNCAPPLRLIFVLSRFVTFGALKFCVEFFNVITELESVSKDGAEYTFTVESYLCDAESDVYKAVKELAIGDVIDMEGFLYWYEGVNPHITAVAAAE